MRRILTAGLLLICIAGCQRAPAPSTQPALATPPPVAETPAGPVSAAPSGVAAPMPAPAPPLPEGTVVSYQCADGNEVTVTYSYVGARLRWPDGRELNLSRPASTPKGGGDVYVGSRASLLHDGGVMHLSQNGGAAVSCTESSSTA